MSTTVSNGGPPRFFTASRVVIVAGKGGVGKTTVTASLARAAAKSGLNPLIVELEGKSGLASMFGREPLDYTEVVLSEADPDTGSGEVRARTLTPDDALIEYLNESGLKRLSKRLVASGVVDMVSTAIPGIRDIIVLAKVKQIERTMAAGVDGAPDLILIDAPAAGHAIGFLRSAQGLLDAVRVGPIRAQAADVQEMLSDASRTQVLLVTLPEETPVNELVETAFSLEDEIGVSLGPVVVNGLYANVEGLDTEPVAAAEEAGVTLRAGEASSLAAAADFRRHRIALQAAQVGRLAEQLPLPQVSLPFLFEAELDPAGLDLLADVMLDAMLAMPDVVADVDPDLRAGDGS